MVEVLNMLKGVLTRANIERKVKKKLSEKKKEKKQKAFKVKRKSIWKDVGNWELLLLCLPAVTAYVIFHYIPLVMAFIIPFKDYKFSKGVWGSEWCGFKNFEWILYSTSVLRSIRNTVLYSLWFMVIGPLANVTMALLLFEVKSNKALKVFQTIITFPNFMSMVVVGYITYAIFSPTTGAMNNMLVSMGFEKIDVYMTAGWWPALLTLVSTWKGIGMGSMMYFASLVGIDTALFEAAEIDGANRWQKTKYISIPHLVPLICIFTILAVGGLFSGNFDLFYIIPRNVPVTYETTDILPTYIYRALQEGTYATGAAVSLLQSIAGCFLVVIANLVVKVISPENSLF